MRHDAYPFETVCENCKQTFGNHCLDKCPNPFTTRFIPLRTDNVKDIRGIQISYLPRTMEVTKVVALKYNQLPKKYLDYGWRCWLSDDEKEIVVLTPGNRCKNIAVSEKLNKKYVQQMKKELNLCGDNLMRINKESIFNPDRPTLGKESLSEETIKI